MGERKGTNKYYPPDFDPKKHGSLSGYTKSHPLRERARKLHLGILIIRFEMPYNIWCGGCNNPIGMGVRYNAEKSKVGMYYTTPIYKFRMKCHLCDNHFEIKTDPANQDYVIISGARRKEQRWDPKENEQIVPEDKASQKKLALDAMYKLEHGVDDKVKVKGALPGIAQLEELQLKKRDNYLLNKLARQKFRTEKKIIKSQVDTDQSLLTKSSLDIDLVKEHQDDVKLAGLLQYSTAHTFDERQKLKREEINSRPLFGLAPAGSSPAGSGSSSSGSLGSASASEAQLKQRQLLAEARKRMGLTSSGRQSQGFGSPMSTKSVTSGIVRKHPSDKSSSAHSSLEGKTDSFVEQTETLTDAKEDSKTVEESLHNDNVAQATTEVAMEDSADSTEEGDSEKGDSVQPNALNSLVSSYDSSSSDGD